MSETGFRSVSFKESWWRDVQPWPKAKMAAYFTGLFNMLFDGIEPEIKDPRSPEYLGYFKACGALAKSRSGRRKGETSSETSSAKRGVNRETSSGTSSRTRTPIENKKGRNTLEMCESGTHTDDVFTIEELDSAARVHFDNPPTAEFLEYFHRRMRESGWVDRTGRPLTRALALRELSAWWEREQKNFAARASSGVVDSLADVPDAR